MAIPTISNLAGLYRRKVAALQAALGREDAPAARERIPEFINGVHFVSSPADAEAPPAFHPDLARRR